MQPAPFMESSAFTLGPPSNSMTNTDTPFQTMPLPAQMSEDQHSMIRSWNLNAEPQILSRTPRALPPTRHPQAPISSFLALPQELLDMIYTELIKAEDIKFLRTSREIYMKAKPLLFKHTFLRMNTRAEGPHYEIPCTPPLDQTLIPLIQNIEIKVLLEPMAAYRYRGTPFQGFGPIARFTGLEIQRRTCRIVFRSSFESKKTPKPRLLLACFRHMIGFEKVMVVVLYPSVAEDVTEFKGRVRRKVAKIYNMAIEELEGSLGPALWCDSELQGVRNGGGHLEFYPRKYLAEQAAEGAESDREDFGTEMDWSESEIGESADVNVDEDDDEVAHGDRAWRPGF